MSGGVLILFGICAALTLGMLAWPFIASRDAFGSWQAWPPLL
jgi:hypothetical protein